MNKNTKQFVWVRMGDMDDYDKFQDVAEATDMMKIDGLRGPLQWGLRGKLVAPGFEGNNFISCFWGDNDGNYIRDFNVEKVVEKEV